MLHVSATAQLDQRRLPNIDVRSNFPQQALGATSEQQRIAGLLREHDSNFEVDFDELLGTPKFVHSRDGFLTGPRGEGAYGADTIAVLDNLARLFRIQDAERDFAAEKVESDALGFHHVRLHQMHRGLRVVSGDLIVHFNRDDRAYQVNGSCVTDIDVEVVPRIAAAEAVRLAQQAIVLTAASVGERLQARRVVLAPPNETKPLGSFPCQLTGG